MLPGDPNGWPWKDWAWFQWREKYGLEPPWADKEWVSFARCKARVEGEDALRKAWTNYLECEEPFFEGHPPGKFLLELGRFLVRSSKVRIPSIVKKAESFPGARRAAEMTRILVEIEKDDSIPQTMKRSEAAKRWKEIPPEL